ncbi:Ankyrin repeat and SOCS box protein 3 [Podochytrium sp. JEL0797]|nr:Ankyrin repeat and SOCS box protein 3 [Podochytrium sp. JEL0797]
MSGKGFGSPLFKRKPSAAPSISTDHPDAKRPANLTADTTAQEGNIFGSKLRSRAGSDASRCSIESKPPASPTISTSTLPPLSIKPVDEITTLTVQKIKAPSYLESKKLNTLHSAVHAGDLRKLKSLVAEKARDINKPDTYHGFSALHLAVDENKYDIATILIEPVLALADKDTKTKEHFEKSPLKQINLNSVNREGRTPLILAVIRGYSDIVHLLLKNHADINVQDMIGCSALHYAIYLGDISSFKLLTDRGAKTDVIDKSGIPLFYHAIKCKRSAMAELLIAELTSDALNVTYGLDQSTALHLAVENSMTSVIHTLVDLGVNPVALDAEKRKPVERINYADYDQDIVDFLTMTELSMFGSITSFVDTAGSKVSKSVLSLISKSAASLVSPKNSQSQLLVPDSSVLPADYSEQAEIKDASEIITSPLLSFSGGDEISESEEINEMEEVEFDENDSFDLEDLPYEVTVKVSHSNGEGETSLAR